MKRKTAFYGAVALSAWMATTASAERLTIGLASEPTSLDPHFHNLGPNNAMSVHIFDRLIKQDERQRLTPGLAVSWEPIDELTWEFKLREGVKFHDGTDFNADDVVCTWERAPDVPNSPSGYGTYTKGKTVKKIDDYTVHFISESPYPLMANDVSVIPVISDSAGCGATTEAFNAGTAAIGTGPFKFGSYKPGEAITFVRNDDYWDAASIWSEVEFRPIKSGPSRVAALLAGDVDMITGVPTTDIGMLGGRDDVTLSQGPSNRVIYLHMDHSSGATHGRRGLDDDLCRDLRNVPAGSAWVGGGWWIVHYWRRLCIALVLEQAPGHRVGCLWRGQRRGRHHQLCCPISGCCAGLGGHSKGLCGGAGDYGCVVLRLCQAGSRASASPELGQEASLGCRTACAVEKHAGLALFRLLLLCIRGLCGACLLFAALLRRCLWGRANHCWDFGRTLFAARISISRCKGLDVG